MSQRPVGMPSTPKTMRRWTPACCHPVAGSVPAAPQPPPRRRPRSHPPLQSWRTTLCSPCSTPGRRPPTARARAEVGEAPRSAASASGTPERPPLGSTRKRTSRWTLCPPTRPTPCSPCGLHRRSASVPQRLARLAHRTARRRCAAAACVSRTTVAWWSPRRPQRRSPARQPSMWARTRRRSSRRSRGSRRSARRGWRSRHRPGRVVPTSSRAWTHSSRKRRRRAT
mmetsp:Transcript_48861/g.156245  ORF Transcript_48861/g.156245 Transcript_48861/m.156245 type:complete len:226 (+) Transcript_48861:1571-2248(+)